MILLKDSALDERLCIPSLCIIPHHTANSAQLYFLKFLHVSLTITLDSKDPERLKHKMAAKWLNAHSNDKYRINKSRRNGSYCTLWFGGDVSFPVDSLSVRLRQHDLPTLGSVVLLLLLHKDPLCVY